MPYPRKLPPLGALRAFEAAARHLSFRRAAEELAVTPTAISHQVRLLEAILGQDLFVRHVRRISLTPAGTHLFPTLQAGLDAFARAIAELDARERRRAVTVTATTLFTARRLIPAIGAFRTRWPHHDLRLHASDEAVDLTRGAADIAVRYGSGPFGDLVAEPLLRERFGVVCSPSLGLSRPEQLLEAALIHCEWHRSDLQLGWERWRALSGLTALDTRAGHHFTDESHAIQAAVAGHGAAICGLALVEDELRRGLLVHPFGPVMEGQVYHLLMTARTMGCADVQAVRDWLRATVRA
ncbi:LysR substrate-binding domain-containing protein [Methylobacterium sp. NEAU 140]|uniref:LysR substrate-binding domain-containing protein n=1 Tax=Methylobacterium sp. NEAU 140 TaxID=3064945 RepID=UPI0027374B2C|nr:LysR substrate-binding domain-containing protein [Methylobacterium sp. NEAU 140]MDP4026786.1 LysR substrate-binding domain-containing protein [Methylobacterium sp. NEAU 140]